MLKTNKTKLTILSSLLLGTALALSAANAAAPRSTPRFLEHLRGPVADRLAGRFGELEDMQRPKAAEKQTRPKHAPPDASYIIIDEPDADPGLYGTRVFFINESNQISGQFMDSSGQFHAFLCRLPACSAREDFTVITVNGSDTFGFTVNDRDEVCGTYVDPDSGVEDAWRRDPKTGAIETLAIGAGGTNCVWVNKNGVVTGYTVDENGAVHGYLWTKDGTVTMLDDPLGGGGDSQGTYPQNINDKGVVSGTVIDSGSVEHGFLRQADGTFSEYDVAGAGQGAWQGTSGIEIEGNGWVTGEYIDSGDALHGFLRSPDGSRVIEVDPADDGTGAGLGNEGVQHLEAGWAVGQFTDANGTYHGYLCTRCTKKDRTIAEFDPPGVGAYGTYTVVSSNRAHLIVGTFKDDNGIRHGFVRNP